MTLKDLLGDLYTPEIEAKLGTHTVYLWNKSDEKEKDKEPIPKFRVNEMIEASKTKATDLEGQVKALEGKLSDADKDLKKLAKAAEGNESLTSEIKELQTKRKEDSEAWEKEKTSLLEKSALQEKSFILKEHLLNAGVGDVAARELLSKNFDVAKLEIGEDKKIKGFDDLLKPVKENKSFSGMFGEITIEGDGHVQGKVSENGYYTREQVAKMSQEDVAANWDVITKSLPTWDKKN